MTVTILLIFFSIFVFFCLGYFIATIFYRKNNHKMKELPFREIVLVPGAGLERNGDPSHILEDRLISAISYTNQHPVKNVVLSGACSADGRCEPKTMRNYLLENGCEKDILEMDNNGFSTFHSIRNFIEKSSNSPFVIISQRFHLTRALLIADLLGADCIGLLSENYHFSFYKTIFWYVREIFATPYNIGKVLYNRFQNSR